MVSVMSLRQRAKQTSSWIRRGTTARAGQPRPIRGGREKQDQGQREGGGASGGLRGYARGALRAAQTPLRRPPPGDAGTPAPPPCTAAPGRGAPRPPPP